jgi:hypothetical protein
MTEVRLLEPVKAVPVAEAFLHGRYGDGESIPGCFSFEEKTDRSFWGYIKFTCPCGCGSFSQLAIGLKTKPQNDVQPTWSWDGNRETPTLTPSIHHIGHWHGYLTAGFWTQA